MKSKLLFGILFAVLIFFGKQLDNSTSLPNQQIVVEFSSLDTSRIETEEALQLIQSRLQNAGATSIQVKETLNGHYTIVYFSDEEISHIQELFSNETHFNLALNTNQKTPLKDTDSDLKKCKLNISEIEDNTSTGWGFNGVYIVDFNHKSDRFSNTKVNTHTFITCLGYINLVCNSLKITDSNSSILNNHLSYKIPLVRAGPLA